MKYTIISLAALLSAANAFAPAAPGITSRTVALGVTTGAAGKPASSKEEDLELTTQIILESISNDADDEGVVDDDDE